MICADILKTPALNTARAPAGVIEIFLAKKFPAEAVLHPEIVVGVVDVYLVFAVF